MFRKLLPVIARLILPVTTLAQVRLLRQPSYSKGRVAFGHLGDIWVANEDGTGLLPLTDNKARDKWIAFLLIAMETTTSAWWQQKVEGRGSLRGTRRMIPLPAGLRTGRTSCSVPCAARVHSDSCDAVGGTRGRRHGNADPHGLGVFGKLLGRRFKDGPGSITGAVTRPIFG
jgi:hypothetical protein